jgi:nucleotide-binding universal stress UspA family protein
MYKHLLIATDGSDLANKAVEQGIALAKILNARITAVLVTESWATKVPGEMAVGFPIDAYEQSCADSASAVLTKVAAAAAAAGVACDQKHVRDQFPADGIIEQSKASGCDLIVMASHGRRGLSRLLLGSQANQVVTHSAVPVLICR